MTCKLCAAQSGQYDMTRECCAVRFIEKATRDDAARLVAQVAAKYGHKADTLRAGVVRVRKERNKP